MSAEISRPNFRAPRANPSGEQPIQYYNTPENVNRFSIEKYIIPFVVPVLSSLLGAAASYTAIRKDIQLNNERITKIEIARQISEEKINNLKTEIAVLEVKLSALERSKTTNRRR